MAVQPRRERIEEPRYTVVEKRRDFEIRLYNELIIAETEVFAGYRFAIREGFRRLAKFIFGYNVSKQSIGMTAPVSAKRGEVIAMTAPVAGAKTERGWIVTFAMPSRYTLETLPKPLDTRVKLRKVKARKVAALPFSGYATGPRVKAKMARLMRELGEEGIKPVGEPTIAQYNPPWTLPFFRRNEILVDVE